MEVRLALCTIAFNGMPFLEGVLETFLPHCEQIVVAEGPVKFWSDQGYERSTDGTAEYLMDFQDRVGWQKMRFIRGVWDDKRQMCAAWMRLLRDDITHLAIFDADEFMHGSDIEAIKRCLSLGRWDSIGLRLCTFVGGFKHYLTGFEQKQDTIRFLRYVPGDSVYLRHRPPTIEQISTGKRFPAPSGVRHLDFETTSGCGIFLYHYSHVLPSQVRAKERYYADYFGSTKNLIPNYYRDVWLPWVKHGEIEKVRIENEWNGIHDFHPSYRGECRAKIFVGYHPLWIEENQKRIMVIQQKEIERYEKEA